MSFTSGARVMDRSMSATPPAPGLRRRLRDMGRAQPLNELSEARPMQSNGWGLGDQDSLTQAKGATFRSGRSGGRIPDSAFCSMR